MIESHTSDDFMTKFYIVLADSAFVGVCFPAQQTSLEGGVGCLRLFRATMVGVWHFSVTFLPLVFQLLDLALHNG